MSNRIFESRESQREWCADTELDEEKLWMVIFEIICYIATGEKQENPGKIK